jgi:DNA-binding protein HU-beta
MANKKDVVNAVHEILGGTKKDSGIAVDAVVSAVSELFVKEGEVKLVGFATFTTAVSKARKARNPKTGETIDVPAKTRAKIRFSKALKEEIELKWPV